MTICFFVSDLHGGIDRYNKLFDKISEERPSAVFLGGDLLPTGLFPLLSNGPPIRDFVKEVITAGFEKLRGKLGDVYPQVFLILGNDDGRAAEADFIAAESIGLWVYVSGKRVNFGPYTVYGYPYVPPTPFQLKDWERYDVSRYMDPGCVPPEEGWTTTHVPKNEIKNATIEQDLERLVGDDDLSNAIMLFHSPPYSTKLDRADLNGKTINHAPVDVHVGSIAVKRFIESRQPLITLHGHIHESPRLTGSWKERIGRTMAFSAAHDGPELALVTFDPQTPETAMRELL